MLLLHIDIMTIYEASKKWHLLHDVQKHPRPVVTHDMQGREKDWFGTHLVNVEWSKVLWSWDGVLIFWSDHWFSHLDPWWYNWQDLTHHYNLKLNRSFHVHSGCLLLLVCPDCRNKVKLWQGNIPVSPFCQKFEATTTRVAWSKARKG